MLPTATSKQYVPSPLPYSSYLSLLHTHTHTHTHTQSLSGLFCHLIKSNELGMKYLGISHPVSSPVVGIFEQGVWLIRWSSC
jgi:hypothetical protein